MKVLFVEDVPGTAYAGDIKEVKPGFARNYLLPYKLAVPATPDQMKRVERLRAATAERRTATEAEMKTLAEKLGGATISLQVRAGRNDRLYGSITNANVAEELAKLAGREIDRRRVIMEPIRQLGNYRVPVKLYPGIEPVVTIVVSSLGVQEELEPTAGEVVEALKREEEEKKRPKAAKAAKEEKAVEPAQAEEKTEPDKDEQE